MINAKLPAKSAPTIQENKTGNPMPPRNPVLAGSTDSIASIPGVAVILNKIIPPKITEATE